MSDSEETCSDGGVTDGEIDVASYAGDPKTAMLDSTAQDPAESATVGAQEHADQELLLEAVRRAPMLTSLRSDPATPSDLVDELDLSRSTIHRAKESLLELDLIKQSNSYLELTRLGEVFADEIEQFSTQIGTATSLKPLLNTIGTCKIPLEHFAGAKVTKPASRRPHISVRRIVELIEESDSLRMFSTVLSPIYVDVGYREMTSGMEIQAIFDEQAIDIMLSEYPEKAYETIKTGNFDVYAHDGLPFELFLFDDRMGMAAHDEDGIARVFVECDAPSAIQWAEDRYAHYFSDAESVL